MVTVSNAGTGVVGVHLNDKLNRYEVSWVTPEGKKGKTSVSITKHGKKEAFKLAYAIRQARSGVLKFEVARPVKEDNSAKPQPFGERETPPRSQVEVPTKIFIQPVAPAESHEDITRIEHHGEPEPKPWKKEQWREAVTTTLGGVSINKKSGRDEELGEQWWKQQERWRQEAAGKQREAQPIKISCLGNVFLVIWSFCCIYVVSFVGANIDGWGGGLGFIFCIIFGIFISVKIINHFNLNRPQKP